MHRLSARKYPPLLYLSQYRGGTTMGKCRTGTSAARVIVSVLMNL